MKIKGIGLLVYFIWVLMAIPVSAQNDNPSKDTSKKGTSQKSKSPIEITSDRMRSENGGVKIIFSGNVVSYKDDLKITSDIMEVYNTEDKKETDEIVAIGNVVITRGLKRATGDRAVYLDKLQKIILTGTPKAIAWEEDNMIEGREMIFLLEKDRFVVNQRVRMKIYPKDEKETPKKESKPSQQDQLSSSN
jgi:lipopolysaccharide export system protein LptA